MKPNLFTELMLDDLIKETGVHLESENSSSEDKIYHQKVYNTLLEIKGAERKTLSAFDSIEKYCIASAKVDFTKRLYLDSDLPFLQYIENMLNVINEELEFQVIYKKVLTTFLGLIPKSITIFLDNKGDITFLQDGFNILNIVEKNIVDVQINQLISDFNIIIKKLEKGGVIKGEKVNLTAVGHSKKMILNASIVIDEWNGNRGIAIVLFENNED